MTDEMSKVLADVWQGATESREETEAACGVTKVCRNMKDVTFDGMAGPGADLATAWREKLRREGKIPSGAQSVGEIIGATGRD